MVALGLLGPVFDPLQEELARLAIAELAMVAAASGALGVWVVRFGRSYQVESLTHGLFPGLVLASLAGASLTLGALAGVALAVVALGLAARAPRTNPASSTAVAVTTLLGFGALLATRGGTRSLDALMFGDPLAASGGSLLLSASIAMVVAATLFVMHRRLAALAFDPIAAAALGVAPRVVETVLLTLLGLTVAVSAHQLGSLLALALIVGPALGALAIARHIAGAVVLGAILGPLAVTFGFYLSYHADIPAGPAVALCCCAMAAGPVVLVSLRRPGSRVVG